MNLVDRLKEDYANFPQNQSYELYAPDVYFQDPMTQFRGIDRYRQMVGFMTTWFKNIHLDLQDIRHQEEAIATRWTLSWNTPLPWNPRISISGRSELRLNAEGLICSHIDYWDCSRWEVVKQHFWGKTR